MRKQYADAARQIFLRQGENAAGTQNGSSEHGISDQTTAAVMPEGSLFLYVGSVYHGGGANRSQEHRTRLSWRRQEENQSKLMGYRRGAYALGYFGDTQDPLEARHGKSEGRGFET